MQYGRPFDHKAHAGTVWGDNRFAYEQGGQLYDAHKRPVDGKGNLMDIDPKHKKAAAAAPKPEAAPAMPAVTEAEDEADDDEEEQIDLVAWAKGHTPSIPWATVKKAIFAQLNLHAQSKKEAAELILAKLDAPANV
jgi:hypothetical protein